MFLLHRFAALLFTSGRDSPTQLEELFPYLIASFRFTHGTLNSSYFMAGNTCVLLTSALYSNSSCDVFTIYLDYLCEDCGVSILPKYTLFTLTDREAGWLRV